MGLKMIRTGSQGPAVKEWQYFLIGQGFLFGDADGKFGPKTKNATMAFQEKYGLPPDGIVGSKSYGAAMLLGFAGGVVDNRTGIHSEAYPPKPGFEPLVRNKERQELFGKFAFAAKPLPGNPEHIIVTDNWGKENLVAVKIPQLVPVKGSEAVWFHRLAARQLVQLWKDWEKAGLLHLVLTWNGAYNPRFIRGGARSRILSNHAFGSAFDINYEWNRLKTIPALVGRQGSVRELVPIANNNGFYWGGHFNRQDGMHFEVARIL